MEKVFAFIKYIFFEDRCKESEWVMRSIRSVAISWETLSEIKCVIESVYGKWFQKNIWTTKMNEFPFQTHKSVGWLQFSEAKVEVITINNMGKMM
jgi:hypothetical protein